MSRITKHLKHSGRVLLGRWSAGRAATIFPDDVYLVSYPKSGNTWVRFLVANLVNQGDPVTFLNIETRLPSIYLQPDRALRKLARPRVLKSHECFVPRYPKVIYIVRDPRDVAVSYYYYNIKQHQLPQSCTLDEYIPLFLADELDMRCGPWSDHVLSWLRMRGEDRNFLLVRYEDLHANPRSELKRVANFLSLDADEARVQRAVELSSARNMRSMEEKQGDQWTFAKGMRTDIPFIRSAKSGGWQAKLSPWAVEQIEGAWGTVMQTVGYTLSKDLTPAEANCLPVR